MPIFPNSVVDFIRAALTEDIGHGDITTSLTVDAKAIAEANVIAKESLVLAGLPFFALVFELLDRAVGRAVEVRLLKEDGAALAKGDKIARVSGNTRSLLMGERVALNILQRLSGIATLTRRFADEVKDLPVQVVDTRKTTPNMRYMEKYAVRIGGGGNHRFGLYDCVLIKDNHIKAAGGITRAVERVRQTAPFLMKVEVEVGNMEELRDALDAGVDVVMLDNMSIEEMVKAVALVNKRVMVEASGNVTLGNIRQIAQTGVDIISSGYLTHSAQAADISMKII
ncbi:Nicotinate-nucleotide pyrophosphorylase [Candidatus Magnetobacterium bavaricum]|uniref:Probable nicotinate-nucleotide pyrophosphorylase [carboxylating] n=1 Tax=Candidatus Magnetobacterium bavaricum TaxID=29290 RepID=A0A0F3GSN3_9BACT|nr:Nicotinate-nucleotide pyrophosphorylase [Candidatus Magnetobacterium bavaricum]